jgi:hypothetical protein
LKSGFSTSAEIEARRSELRGAKMIKVNPQSAAPMQLREWETRLQNTIAGCLREKLNRAATLRAARAVCGEEVSESEVRYLLAELLRDKYQSAIFCDTIMARLGWRDQRVAAARPAPAPFAESETLFAMASGA